MNIRSCSALLSLALAAFVSTPAVNLTAADHPDTKGWKNLISPDLSNTIGGEEFLILDTTAEPNHLEGVGDCSLMKRLRSS